MHVYILAFLVFCQSSLSYVPSAYRTENITGQIIDVKQITRDRSKLAPGYLFFAPVSWVEGWGPKLYDVDGLLIWDGRATTFGIAQQFHVCDYHGTSGAHLCWHEASALGIARKEINASSVHDYNRMYDNTYTQIGPNYTTTGDLKTSTVIPDSLEMEIVPASIDSHEFHIVDNGASYVQTVYLRKEYDLSPWDGRKDGWLLESCFQDIELLTEKVLFNWCYTDHLPIESHIYPDSPKQTKFTTVLAGDGSWFGAWDFWHINSIDKNEEGDYLISGRHNDQILKIAGNDSPNGAPGSVIWKLGGDSNQFEFEDGFVFSRQHDARYISTQKEWTIFTLFDNAWEGEGDENSMSQPYSSGKLITINNATMKAKLVQEYRHPEGHLSRSGGSMQMLPNRNMFIGWGFIRQVTEFSFDGKVLFHAHIKNKDEAGTSNYRNYKYDWRGMPAADPKLVAYARHCDRDSPLIAYVSWNGATEVKRWRFKISEFPGGPWMSSGTFEVEGFETKAILSHHFRPYVRVEALDQYGQVLRSFSTATFVPNEDLLRICDKEGCKNPKHNFYLYETTDSSAALCSRRYSFPIIGFTLVIICIELCSWFYSLVLGANTSSSDFRTDPILDYKMMGMPAYRDSNMDEETKFVD